MKKKNRVLICQLFLGRDKCQNPVKINISPPSVIPVSPEAEKMAKFTNYPVNYSKGLVDITIPLYDIKSGELTLPLSLSYNHSGLKPKEKSGRIATGWTLNAEPSIMRFVHGLPDESNIINQKGFLYIY